MVPLYKTLLPLGGKAAKSTSSHIVISVLQIPRAETTIDLGVTRSGCTQSCRLNQLWFFQDCDSSHKSRGTFLGMKYLIQSQQQLAQTLTFIFISVWNKRHPQAEQAVSYKPPANKAAISSALHRASLCCFVITNSLLNSLILWQVEKCQWAGGGLNSLTLLFRGDMFLLFKGRMAN